MNITQRDRDLGTAYCHEAVRLPDRTDRGRARHPDGGTAAAYWHPIGLVADATDVPKRSARWQRI